MEFEVILPIAISDYETASLNIPRIMRFLHPKSIIVIGRKEIGEKLRVDFPDSSEIRFLNEDTVVPGLTFSSLHSLLKERQAEKRTGWYFQQFIKMAYSLVSDTEFYLSWDADTLPLREKKFFTSSGSISLFSPYNLDILTPIKRN